MTREPPAPVDPKTVSLLWATPDRAPQVAALHAELFDPAWSAESVDRLLDHPAALALLAETGAPRELVGFVIAQIAADEAEILTIGTAPDWKSRGIGNILLGGLKRAAARAGARRLFLEVAADNPAARALYAAAGFEQIGKRERYYARGPGAAVDALTFAVTLPAP